jgi:diguanylate cyclase (GGDEF)-like protein
MPRFFEVPGPRAARRTPPPAPLWTLVLLESVTVLVLLASATWPLSPHAPVQLARVLAAILAVEAVLTTIFARRVGLAVLAAQALAGIPMTVLITGASATSAGTILSCAGYVWVALWIAVFCPPRVLAATLAAEVLGAPVAGLLNAHPIRTLISTLGVAAISALLSAVLAYLVGSLRHAAHHDQLTGLLNRHGVDEALTDLHGRRRRVPVSLVAVDLDGLKAVNDSDGHAAGDRLLAQFAAELRAGIRGWDLAARIGGDEFIAVLPGLSAVEATRWADMLQTESELEWSFGVSERRGEEPLDPWLARADQRMYAAKQAASERGAPRFG